MTQENLDREAARAQLETAERQMPRFVDRAHFLVLESLFSQRARSRFGEISGGIAIELQLFALRI